MPQNRFYVDDPLLPNSRPFLENNEWHHLVHVMRMQEGEEVELVNGKGTLAVAKVAALEKRRAQLHVLHATKENQKPPQIILGIPILRPSKLEWIIEKGTELGVDAFWIYKSELGEKKGIPIERLSALTIAAMKQSGRLFLPHIELLSDFSELFRTEATIFFGDAQGGALLENLSFPTLFITGPEGGYTAKERAMLLEKGKRVRLNPHILRAESAPIAAASILSYLNIRD